MCSDSRQILRTMSAMTNGLSDPQLALLVQTDRQPKAAGWEGRKLIVLVFTPSPVRDKDAV